VFSLVALLAALFLVLTVVFALGGSGGGTNAAAPAVTSSARAFLIALTNFDAKSVDADFGAITSMATGSFAGQANKFFNSAIRQELEQALASSRGQIRSLYIQSISGNQAAVYAVVDQLYVNNKLSSPQSDVLRIAINLLDIGGTWKISNVSVLQGPTLGSSSPTG
jgi:hypothetical protein